MMNEMPLSPITDVVKEKIGAKDMFRHEDTNGARTLTEAAEPAPNSARCGTVAVNLNGLDPGLDPSDREVDSKEITGGSDLNESNETPGTRGEAAPADLKTS